MSDNLILYGPGGASAVNLGSWLQADPGPDYGAHGLVQAVEAESFGDGGQFVYERAGIRHMGFPLILASGGVGLSLTQLESLIRLNARPGGYLDVQPEGVPSGEAVRFDLVHGRWEPAYSVFHQRHTRRQGQLLLDTQPYGYWPTWITLASDSGWSRMSPDRVSIMAASIIGDVPGYGRILLSPQTAGMPSGGAGSVYKTDFLAWSVGGSPSLPRFLTSPSWSVLIGGQGLASAQRPDNQASSIAGAATVWRAVIPGGASARPFGWGVDTSPTNALVTSPNYTYPVDARFAGRHRVFVWARQFGGSGIPVQWAADVGDAFTSGRFASANPIATMIDTASMPLYTGTRGYYQMLDLGEISIPESPAHVAAYPSFNETVRLWISVPSCAGSITLDFAGAYLHPVDGPAGFVPYSVNQGSIGQVSADSQMSVALDAQAQYVHFRDTNAASFQELAAEMGYSAQAFHRGGFPVFGATTTNLNILAEDRGWARDTLFLPSVNPSGLPVPSNLIAPQRGGSLTQRTVVQYRPRFAFLKGF